MNMDAFLKKNICQDLAELQPKTEFQGCQLFLKSFQKWDCSGPRSDLMVFNMWDNLSPISRWSHGYPPTLGWVSLKCFFTMPMFCLTMAFFAMLILVVRAIFSVPNGSKTKQKFTRHPRQKITPWFGSQNLAVGCWYMPWSRPNLILFTNV